MARGAFVAIFLGVAACGGPPAEDLPSCAWVVPDPDQRTVVLVYDVAVDAARRRVFATGLGSRHLAEIDADTAEIVAVHPVLPGLRDTPRVVVDDDGAAWVGASSPALTRLGVDGELTAFEVPLVDARAVVAVGSGVIAVGSAAGGSAVARYTARGPTAVRELPAAPSTLFDLGGAAALATADAVEVLDTDTLAAVERCALPFLPSSGTRLDDGTWVIADKHHVGLAWRDGRPPVVLEVGQDNHDVLSRGDHALVLDRVALEPGFDPNLGVARRVDPDGTVTALWRTGKNGGLGEVDPATGRLWVNSEGTTEVWAIDVASGDLAATVQTGAFADGLAIDPVDADVQYITGRISNTVARVAAGEVTHSVRDVFWPYHPVVDVPRDVVWVLSQTAAQVVGLDRADLSPRHALDLGLPPNVTLVFDGLALHPIRGTLLVADSGADVLVEVEPVSGEVVGQWALGGPAVADPDAIAELAVVPDEITGDVLVLRTLDGRVHRLRDGALEPGPALPADVLGGIASRNRTDSVVALADVRRLYVGGYAFDLDTLARAPGFDLPAFRVIGRNPRAPDELLVVDPSQRELQRMRLDGTVTGALGYAAEDQSGVVYRVDPHNARVGLTRPRFGLACLFDVERID